MSMIGSILARSRPSGSVKSQLKALREGGVCSYLSNGHLSQYSSDMQTNPLSPIPLPASGCLNHLHFISKLPDVDAGMTIDGGYQTDRYLVVGLSEFGTCKPQASVKST